MAKIIYVRCNGKGRHINKIDLNEILKPTIVFRASTHINDHIPERLVLPCFFCTEGNLIINKKIISENL